MKVLKDKTKEELIALILRLDRIIAQLPGHIYWKDVNGVYQGCNNQQARTAQLNSREDIVGLTDAQLPWNKDAKDVVTALQKIDKKILTSGKPYIVEEPGATHSGELATYLSSKIPMYDSNGNLEGLLGISVDITDRKRAEHAEARAQAEEEFRQAIMILSGSVAHDFRTPLSILSMIMKGFNEDIPVLVDGYQAAIQAELPLENELDERGIERIEKRLSGGIDAIKDLNSIIDQNLKTLSRSTLTELANNDLIQCNSHHCLHNTLERYPFTDAQRKLISLDEVYNFDFMGNELLMIRVLSNLIKNSLEQIEQNKKGEIKISTKEHSDKNTIHVHDTAGGCPPEMIDKLFSGFHTTKKGGTGIGLAFCKKTLNSFGADISCHSAHGDYMEFVLAFPKIS